MGVCNSSINSVFKTSFCLIYFPNLLRTLLLQIIHAISASYVRGTSTLSTFNKSKNRDDIHEVYNGTYSRAYKPVGNRLQVVTRKLGWVLRKLDPRAPQHNQQEPPKQLKEKEFLTYVLP